MIQAKNDQEKIFAKNKSIMIYDFLPMILHSQNNQLYCELSMIIKPITEIKYTKDNHGKPFHLIINNNTSEVMNHRPNQYKYCNNA